MARFKEFAKLLWKSRAFIIFELSALWNGVGFGFPVLKSIMGGFYKGL